MSNFSISCLFSFRRVKIEGFNQIIEPEKGIALFTTVSPDQRYKPICHKCGSKADGIHSHYQRTLQDLNFGNNPSFIIQTYHKVYCSNCGNIRVEELEITDPGGANVTNRMAQYIHDLCCLMPIAQVAKHFKLDWKTVKEIDKKEGHKLKDLKYLFIRINIRGGLHSCPILVYHLYSHFVE